ncbi:ASKHA domain-containing protein [Ramlibacter sp.]|uniref:ASKHA domain-containing protein n=1 Tax=Ramlibacter sp. TaxID=1917967 RepID=UPI002D38CBBC|nr:ASKHA domain-containing protein [Ramlibacter sp.]HYD74504.1 ASKHA domain-containing protein [Ramlibacter sp.]
MDLRSPRPAPAIAGPVRSHQVQFPALDRSIECREDETLFAAARRAGLRILGACGGGGTCGTCIVRIRNGSTQRGDEGSRRKWERACQVQPRSGLEVELAPRSLAPIVRAEVGSEAAAALPLDPAVSRRCVQVAPASLDDLASDADRLRRALLREDPPLQPIAIERGAAAALPALLRAHQWRVDVRLAHGEAGLRIAGVAAPQSPLLGLAVDLGTTNAAGFLVDLESGRRLASLGLENPQVPWGADLITRINHAIKDGAAAKALQQAAVDVIASLAHELTRAVGASATDIADVTVCGNTAMQHLLAGWPVAQLGRSPFVAAANEPLDVPAAELGLRLARGAQLHLAPGVGGFVGGDHVAALLATEPLWSQPGTTLVLDIGTNTELSLVHQGRIGSASCPSGPALEGGNIGSGMRAAEGAIERVRIDDTGRLQLQVIGGKAPVGLCGSGVLDTLAALLQAGWIDARGRIAADAPAVGQFDGLRAVILAEETEAAPAVRFTQHDVRAVQLAKSAIRTGAQLLCAEAGIDEGRVDRCLIAGAFGAYIDVGSAVAIGLLPPLPRERFQQVGNAAGLGVQQMLASRERRRRAAQLAARCRYVELSSRSDFQRTFLHHIGFPPPREPA